MKQATKMTVAENEKQNVQDQVIGEVRKIKDDLAKKYSYDIDIMIQEARSRQKTSGHTILTVPSTSRNTRNHKHKS